MRSTQIGFPVVGMLFRIDGVLGVTHLLSFGDI
jgi:hypothetical protein